MHPISFLSGISNYSPGSPAPSIAPASSSVLSGIFSNPCPLQNVTPLTIHLQDSDNHPYTTQLLTGASSAAIAARNLHNTEATQPSPSVTQLLTAASSAAIAARNHHNTTAASSAAIAARNHHNTGVELPARSITLVSPIGNSASSATSSNSPSILSTISTGAAAGVSTVLSAVSAGASTVWNNVSGLFSSQETENQATTTTPAQAAPEVPHHARVATRCASGAVATVAAAVATGGATAGIAGKAAKRLRQDVTYAASHIHTREAARELTEDEHAAQVLANAASGAAGGCTTITPFERARIATQNSVVNAANMAVYGNSGRTLQATAAATVNAVSNEMRTLANPVLNAANRAAYGNSGHTLQASAQNVLNTLHASTTAARNTMTAVANAAGNVANTALYGTAGRPQSTVIYAPPIANPTTGFHGAPLTVTRHAATSAIGAALTPAINHLLPQPHSDATTLIRDTATGGITGTISSLLTVPIEQIATHQATHSMSLRQALQTASSTGALRPTVAAAGRGALTGAIMAAGSSLLTRTYHRPVADHAS